MDAAHRVVGLSFFLLALLSIGCGKADTNVDDMIGQRAETQDLVAPPGDEATQGPFEQPVGFYSKGRIVSATNIGLSGPGFIKLYLKRDTGWGSFDLIAVLRKAIEALNAKFPNLEPVQIGDIARKTGGQLLGHESHQNGLDVDVRFLARNHHVQNPDSNTGFDEKYVRSGRVTSNFDIERNWLLIKSLVSSGRINRIFADGAIKKALCLNAKKTGDYVENIESLRRLQAYPAHTDHMHVRITCPRASPRCENQNQPPAVSGC
jgi:penicillin-insensitive murein endopeptidase